jgi:phosphatidylinositol 4-kinase
MNLSSIKEKLGGKDKRLKDYFLVQFGSEKTKAHKVARRNFCKSLAAYSLLCYILQIKDRHNENIMIDIEGHIFHIDFGFLLSNAPGKGLKFESAPFKLNTELVEVLGGDHS